MAELEAVSESKPSPVKISIVSTDRADRPEIRTGWTGLGHSFRFGLREPPPHLSLAELKDGLARWDHLYVEGSTSTPQPEVAQRCFIVLWH